MKPSFKITALCFVLVLMPASIAVAQTSADAAPRRVADRAGGIEYRPVMSPTEEVEARLAYVKTALKITSGQLAQWEAYANLSRRFYCADTRAYYPYVRECPSAWQRVPSQPPSPR